MPEIEPHDDESFMRLAIELAAQGQGSVEPNPMVGCVIVQGGKIIGQGYHAQFGGPHAEVAALNSLSSAADARGATVYVTLEPCCHQGKTPPCSAALIAAGVSRVVVAMQDPFAQVDGGGIEDLRQAGIATAIGLLSDQAQQLNAPYLKRVRCGLPYVIAKWAMTADGRIATATGNSQWITNQTSRRHVHQLRGRVDAIMTGMGTVRADDPTLTARPPGPRTATRVVFCRQQVPPIESKLMQSLDVAPVLIVASDSLPADQLAPLDAAGAEVFRCGTRDPQEMILSALGKLAESGATNVMVEGGGELLGSFLSAGQLDECHVYIGPKLFGGKQSPGPIGGAGLLAMDDARQLHVVSIDRFDDDFRIVYRCC